MPVTSCDTLRERLNALKRSGMTWRKIAESGEFPDVPAGTLCSIAKGYEPKSPDLRARLGLAPTATVVSVNGAIPDGTQVPGHAVCQRCGKTYAKNVWNRGLCYDCLPLKEDDDNGE